MNFKEPYILAMRERDPALFRSLRRAGEMDAHLQAKSREAHTLLLELLKDEPVHPDGRLTDDMARMLAEEQVLGQMLAPLLGDEHRQTREAERQWTAFQGGARVIEPSDGRALRQIASQRGCDQPVPAVEGPRLITTMVQYEPEPGPWIWIALLGAPIVFFAELAAGWALVSPGWDFALLVVGPFAVVLVGRVLLRLGNGPEADPERLAIFLAAAPGTVIWVAALSGLDIYMSWIIREGFPLNLLFLTCWPLVWTAVCETLIALAEKHRGSPQTLDQVGRRIGRTASVWCGACSTLGLLGGVLLHFDATPWAARWPVWQGLLLVTAWGLCWIVLFTSLHRRMRPTRETRA